jgi:hypothetical protein
MSAANGNPAVTAETQAEARARIFGPWEGHAEDLADWFLARMVNRPSGYGRYLARERRTEDSNAYPVKKPLTRDDLIRHAKGGLVPTIRTTHLRPSPPQ